MTVRSTSQIVASLYDKHDAGTSLTDLLCVDCTDDLRLRGTALSVGDGGGLVAVVGASAPHVRLLEERQVELGEGPAVDAARTGEPSVHLRLDHTALGRWPAYAPLALDAGVGSVLAWPLSVVALRIGALAMYRSPGALEAGALDAAKAWAEAAVVILLDLQAADRDGSGALSSSVGYNAEIHQATGFVSVTAAVGLDDALVMLRAHAFSSGRTLLQVARDVLADRLVIEGPGGHDG